MKISMAWSGGKDSALALSKLLQKPEIEVVHLHTVFNAENQRVGMHGIHQSLIEQQAESIGLPLKKLYLPTDQSHGSYEKLMTEFCQSLKNEGIEAIAFGDIFLEDLKQYRELMLSNAGLRALFPLWGEDTEQLTFEFLAEGFETIICAADAGLIEEQWLGKPMNQAFLDQLPCNVDPCGENGEFHTFVINGPIFKTPLKTMKVKNLMQSYTFKSIDNSGNEITEKKHFNFCELELLTS